MLHQNYHMEKYFQIEMQKDRFLSGRERGSNIEERREDLM